MALPRVLIVYTGGTFGMTLATGAGSGIGSGQHALRIPKLSPASLRKRFLDRVPELERLARCDVEVLMNRDSSHVGPDEWILLARRIRAKWKSYDGVVVLHGTDTLAYTASALSFLLRPCLRPVVITGAQQPLSAIRTDARRNLMSAVEIAAQGPRDVVTGVSVFFDDRLLVGNRARKRSAIDFDAFESPDCPPLAQVGTRIRYAPGMRLPRRGGGPKLRDAFDRKVAVVKVTPALPARALAEGLLPRVSALVLVVFSSGTATTHDPEFLELLREARRRRVPVIAVTEGASEDPRLYEAGRLLLKEGCLWAAGMTPECAYVKASLALGQGAGPGFARLWRAEWAGEAGGS